MKRITRTAKLVFRQKLVMGSGRLRDAVVWAVPKCDRYPDGIRYRLALVDPLKRELIVLFDNHFPKGHHRHHKNGEELPYRFESVAKLVDDYLQAVEEEENGK